MSKTECTTIDTRSFEAVMDLRAELIRDYDKINSEYDRIERTLLENWEGRGSNAFRDDSRKVRTNIGGISDILNIMSDVLIDCREVIRMSDQQAGAVNADPFTEGD